MSGKPRFDCAHPARKKRQQNSSWFLFVGIALIAVALLAFIWFALTPQRASSGTPQLQVNTERLDFGKQIFEKPVHASFQIKNVGSGTLTLSVPRSATLLEGC